METTHIRELESHEKFIRILIDRMSPLTSAIVPDELKRRFRDASDDAMKAEEEMLTEAITEVGGASGYEGRTIPQFIVLLLLLLIPMAVVILSETKLTGISVGLRRFIENFSTGMLWVLFLPAFAWLVFTGKKNDDGGSVTSTMVMYISFGIMVVLTAFLRWTLFGSRLVWIPAFAAVNAVVLLVTRKKMYDAINDHIRKEQEHKQREKELTDIADRLSAKLDETVRAVDRIYQAQVDAVNEEYGTSYALPASMTWDQEISTVAEPWRPLLPGTFMGVPDGKVRVEYDFHEHEAVTVDSTSVITVTDFNADWQYLNYDTAARLLASGSFEPLFGKTYPIEQLNRPRFAFLLRVANWTTEIKTETTYTSTTSSTVQDTERQERYKRNRTMDDIALLGDTMEALQFDRNPAVAMEAMDIIQYREEKMEKMTKTVVETTTEHDTDTKTQKHTLYAGILVMDVQTKSAVEAFCFKGCPIEAARFFYDFLNGSSRSVPGYYCLAADHGSAVSIAKSAFLTWKKYQKTFEVTTGIRLPYDIWE